MNKLITKARSGVTLVELLVVILIVTILSVSLLPLLKPYIEQAKYAAEVQPTLANIQTKINLYQYEKDQLPCTIAATDAQGKKTETAQDGTAHTWMLDTDESQGKARVYKAAKASGLNGTSESIQEDTSSTHLSHIIDVNWQDLLGKRINPSQFRYHVIKGLGAAAYGYAVGIFGDSDGIARGTGYAVLVLVDTTAKVKVIATWERYKPESDEVVSFKVGEIDTPNAKDKYCHIPTAAAAFGSILDESSGKERSRTAKDWDDLLDYLKGCGWSFNFDEVTSGGSATK